MINVIGQKDQVVGYPLKLSWDSRKLDNSSLHFCRGSSRLNEFLTVFDLFWG